MDDVIATGSTLRLRHRFDAIPARVFQAWTRPEALRLWWCPPGWRPLDLTIDLREGGAFRFAMIRDSGTGTAAVSGEFLEVRRDHRLVYTWRWEGAFPAVPETVVTVEFRSEGDGTELLLRQERLKMPDCVRHVRGWLAACGRIEAVLSAGGQGPRSANELQRA